MSSHPFDKLPLGDGSTLIFTPCPGTKEVSLRESLRQLVEGGARAVITLMPADEMARNDASTLPEVCLEMGIRWFHFPIEDDASPGQGFEQPWEEQKQQVFEMLNQRMAIAIHCKGGSGRTGLMAAIIMLERGIPFEQTVSQVKSLRPNALKLPVHINYLSQTYNG